MIDIAIFIISVFKRGKINRYSQSVGPLQLLRVCQEIVGNKGLGMLFIFVLVAAYIIIL